MDHPVREELPLDKLTLRTATSADAENILGALLGLADHVGERDIVQIDRAAILRDGFGENPAFSVMIAEVDGSFAGMCLHFRTYSTWFGASGIYVQDLFVDPAFRNRNIGEALLARVAREGAERGCNHLKLSVDTGNPHAQRFYDRIGILPLEHDEMRMAMGGNFASLAARDQD
jgi:ribosomal protein S18 acetylase RimI-like enzyme